ncbi:ATP-grasp domain-domain-containing protein [Aspergillus taichungensis]|uniref:ATP-grasp domain-domain-containing protein n=1 Tax=Aspergillus taichungensis TaxID=482145 RepID=A0A2J5HI93_9EURO|nr:ATP-grasp domain-domain-containing protein [Aspergillus taichungensis]
MISSVCAPESNTVMSGVIIAEDGNNHNARYQCTWRVNETTTAGSGLISWQTIDIFFKKTSSSHSFLGTRNAEDTQLSVEVSLGDRHEIDAQTLGSTEAFGFLLDCLAAADNEHGSTAKLVVPQSQGYIVRSDIIPLRLLDCPAVTRTVGFAKPHQFFHGEPITSETVQQTLHAFVASAGGMLLKYDISTEIQACLVDLEAELQNRLSFPWLSTQVPKRKTLALVEGGRRSPESRGNGETVFTAAKALGIDMVVLDNPGHWLEGPRWAHWRKTFLPMECGLQSDEVFTRRVVDTIRAYDGHLDGLITFCDHYQEPVAAAALELGLPACSPEAFAVATDKFRLRLFEGHEAYRASSAEEATHIVKERKLDFPLIFKPCVGYLSEGVCRVDNLAQIEAAVQSINLERHGAAFSIEHYCDGPEVDANFVLCDGDLLYFEASDEFPKGADVNGTGSVNSFIELANVFPSRLPADELALLRDSLHQSLLQIGFRDGVFHLEARVAKSRMEFVMKDDVLDLTERSVPHKGDPSAWLIEVNPRPPGIEAADAVKHTYGIDYWGLGLLFGLQDRERVRQLSHPFLQGAQYWCEAVFIPIEKGGIFDSEDVCVDLFRRRPDIAECVTWYHCHYTKGSRVPDPQSTGVLSWAAHFNVFSRSSRAHVLEIGETIRKEVRFTIV